MKIFFSRIVYPQKKFENHCSKSVVRRSQNMCDCIYHEPSENILEHFKPQVIAVSPQQNSLSGKNRLEDTFSRLWRYLSNIETPKKMNKVSYKKIKKNVIHHIRLNYILYLLYADHHSWSFYWKNLIEWQKNDTVFKITLKF